MRGRLWPSGADVGECQVHGLLIVFFFGAKRGLLRFVFCLKAVFHVFVASPLAAWYPCILAWSAHAWDTLVYVCLFLSWRAGTTIYIALVVRLARMIPHQTNLGWWWSSSARRPCPPTRWHPLTRSHANPLRRLTPGPVAHTLGPAATLSITSNGINSTRPLPRHATTSLTTITSVTYDPKMPWSRLALASARAAARKAFTTLLTPLSPQVVRRPPRQLGHRRCDSQRLPDQTVGHRTGGRRFATPVWWSRQHH